MTTILLVEDEENYRDPLAFNLRRDGFEVLEAEDGAAAIDLFEARTTGRDGGGIDLVILDVGLPDIDGFEVLERIRGQGVTVPVIMLTARSSVEDRVAGLGRC